MAESSKNKNQKGCSLIRQSSYLWGIDGYGRAHVALKSDRVVLLSMLDGFGGLIGVLDIEKQT